MTDTPLTQQCEVLEYTEDWPGVIRCPYESHYTLNKVMYKAGDHSDLQTITFICTEHAQSARKAYGHDVVSKIVKEETNG